MGWSIEFSKAAEKEMAHIDREAARRILRFLHDRVAALDDPRALGEALKGSKLSAFWKYRVGDYRIVAHIEDAVLRILVVRIGHRRQIYRDR